MSSFPHPCPSLSCFKHLQDLVLQLLQPLPCRSPASSRPSFSCRAPQHLRLLHQVLAHTCCTLYRLAAWSGGLAYVLQDHVLS